MDLDHLVWGSLAGLSVAAFCLHRRNGSEVRVGEEEPPANFKDLQLRFFAAYFLALLGTFIDVIKYNCSDASF